MVVEELRGEGVLGRSHRPSRPARRATVALQSRNEAARIHHFVWSMQPKRGTALRARVP